MKKFILYILAVLAGSSLFIACEEQNEMEARVVQTVPENRKHIMKICVLIEIQITILPLGGLATGRLPVRLCPQD